MRIHVVRGTEAALELSLFLIVWVLSLTLLGLFAALATVQGSAAILFLILAALAFRYMRVARHRLGLWTSVILACFLGSMNALLGATLTATNVRAPEPTVFWLIGLAFALLATAFLIEWTIRER